MTVANDIIVYGRDGFSTQYCPTADLYPYIFVTSMLVIMINELREFADAKILGKESPDHMYMMYATKSKTPVFTTFSTSIKPCFQCVSSRLKPNQNIQHSFTRQIIFKLTS